MVEPVVDTAPVRNCRVGSGSRLDVRTRFDDRPDRRARREPARPTPSPAVTTDVCKPQLVERGKRGAAGVKRYDVVNGRRAPRARRRVEVDRGAAQFAAIIRARAQLGHQPRDVVAPRPAKCTTSGFGLRRAHRVEGYA
jgi:hypothetical protein